MNKKKNSEEIFKELLAHTGFSANKLAKELKLPTNAFLYRIKNGKNKISAKLAGQITDLFEDVNYTYLLTGIGTLTQQEVKTPDNVFINTNGNVFTEKKDGSFNLRVRSMSFNNYPNYLNSLKNQISYPWEEMNFCVDQFGKGNYQGFKTNSNSMNGGKLYDTPNTASLLGRELNKHHWLDGFRETESGWVILTDKNIFHKDITSLNIEKETIICSSRSDSPEFVDFELHLNQINQIFKIIKRTF